MKLLLHLEGAALIMDCVYLQKCQSHFFFFTPLDSHLGKNKMGEIKELLITNIPQHFQVFFLSSFLPSFLPFL